MVLQYTENMTGKVNGVKENILQKNALARFVPYAGYSLKIAREYAVWLNNTAATV
jgi:hypothetical protein